MLLGSDLDCVVIDIWPILEKRFKELYDIDVPYEEVRTYKIEKCTPLTSKQVWTVINEVLSRTDLPVYPDALFYLKKYIKDSKVLFITSRKQRFNNETFLNLAQHFEIGQFQTFFEGIFSKADFINRLKIDYFVEDRIKHIVSIAENCPDCTVIVMDRPWNRFLNINDYNGMLRVKSWKEIMNIAYWEKAKGALKPMVNYAGKNTILSETIYSYCKAIDEILGIKIKYPKKEVNK